MRYSPSFYIRLFFCFNRRGFLLLFTAMILSACGGGGDGGDATVTVSLTVTLFDVPANGSPSGQQVKISDGGEIDFTCFQSPSLGVTVDSRCDTEAAGTNLDSASIVFGSLPTQRSYTLTHSDVGGFTRATCSVRIDSSTELVAQSPCVQIDTNRIRMDLS
ncbi:MAG: hypothetical protein ACE5GK_02055 [Nitrospiria bacterium]